MAKYKLHKSGVYRIDDNSYIPSAFTEVMTEGGPVKVYHPAWIEYLKWVTEGNTPDPEFTPEELAAQAAAEAKAAEIKQIISDGLPDLAKVLLAVDNIANLADAKAFIRKLAKVVYVYIKADTV